MASLLAAFCLALSAPVAQAQEAPQARVAGTIELTDGKATIEAKDGSTRAPAVNESVYEGDSITTSRGAEVHLHMADGAQMIVREDSKVKFTEYVADGGTEDRSLVELARGAMRSITGWIGQFNRTKYRIKTPMVTIGVRGTDHEPTHLLPGDPRGEPGSYDKVNDGSAFMETKQGIVEVPKNKAVFHSISGKSAPRLLGAIPTFFKPGKHEQRFVVRAQEAKKAMPQRRLERQQFVQKHGPMGGAKGVRPAQSQKAMRMPVKPAAKPPAPAHKDLRVPEKFSKKGHRPEEKKH